MSRVMRGSTIGLDAIGTLAALLLAATPATVPAGPEEQRQGLISVLNFDRWGDLKNDDELQLAKIQLAEFRPQRVIIMCYGWGNDGRASAATYRRFVDGIQHHDTDRPRPERVAVIGIGWDSSMSSNVRRRRSRRSAVATNSSMLPSRRDW
jgi:hypothetical protein